MNARAPFVALVAVVVVVCAERAIPSWPVGRLLDRGVNEAIDPAAPDVAVTVRVENERGAAVADAQVVVIAGWSKSFETPVGGHGSVGEDGVVSATTDAAGRVVAKARLGKCVTYLRAAAVSGYRAGLTARRFTRDFADGAATELVVVLAPGPTYKGRVVDSTGRPVTDAEVQCHFGSGDFDLACGVATDGSFHCGPVPVDAEHVWLSAVHDGPIRKVWSNEETHPAVDRPIAFVLDPVTDVPADRK